MKAKEKYQQKFYQASWMNVASLKMARVVAKTSKVALQHRYGIIWQLARVWHLALAPS